MIRVRWFYLGVITRWSSDAEVCVEVCVCVCVCAGRR